MRTWKYGYDRKEERTHIIQVRSERGEKSKSLPIIAEEETVESLMGKIKKCLVRGGDE